MTTQGVADGQAAHALAYQLHIKKGPLSALIGGRRMFDEDILEAWIAEQFEKASA